MTFAGAPLSLVGPALAAGAAALVALYLLKLRRRRLEVPFADLWRRVLSETQSTALGSGCGASCRCSCSS